MRCSSDDNDWPIYSPVNENFIGAYAPSIFERVINGFASITSSDALSADNFLLQKLSIEIIIVN